MNILNKISIYGFIAVMSLSFLACSDDDELLEPTVGYNDNWFAIPDDAPGPEVELRRDFYKKTGVNLVFSDLLGREYLGVDAYGDEVWKDITIDFKYNLTSYYDVGPEFTEYETIEQKREAVEFVEEYILPHIDGSSLKPFSFLLVNTMLVPKNVTYGNLVDGVYASCWRSTALAVGDVKTLSAEEKKELAVSMLIKIVDEKLDHYSKTLSQFNNMTDEYDGEIIRDYDPDWDRSDMSIVYEMGYLSYSQSWRGPERDYFTYYGDFDNFFKAVLSRDEAEFKEEFQDYPRVITKYNIMKAAVQEAGYKF